MDLEYDMTVKITPDELAELIAKKVSSDLGDRFQVDPKKIKFKVEKRMIGNGPMEHETVVFEGAEIKADFIPGHSRGGHMR